MEAMVTGIGWVTGGGRGCGRQGGDFRPGELPLPVLERPDVFPKPSQRFGRMSDYAKLGIAAIAFALRDAGLEEWEVKRRFGVVAGTVLGCLATDLDYHRTILLEGGELASPNLFAYTLANCFLGDAAIQFGLTGSLFAINGSRGGLDALSVALEEIAMGEAETMLAGVCELPAPEALAGEVGLDAGAVFLVLSSASGSEARGYGRIALDGGRRVSFQGCEVGSIAELVRKALGEHCLMTGEAAGEILTAFPLPDPPPSGRELGQVGREGAVKSLVRQGRMPTT